MAESSSDVEEFFFFSTNHIDAYPVSAEPRLHVWHFFQRLQREDDYRSWLGKASRKQCKFYKLKSPVDLEAEKDQILQRDNWEVIDPTKTRIRDLAPKGDKKLKSGSIYLVIELLEDRSITAVNALRSNYGDFFSSLTIEVSDLIQWTMGDVRRNLRGGVYRDYDSPDLPEDIRAMQQRLQIQRTYNAGGENSVLDDHDFLISGQFNRTLFDRISAPSTPPTSPTVQNTREFSTFYNLLRCFQMDVESLSQARSSALKAGSFTAYFIHPPFSLSATSNNFEYTTDMPWNFPILLRLVAQDTWRKFTPKSDFMLYAPKHSIPFLISDVISQEAERTKFFVVALYLDVNMKVLRYIAMKTGNDDGEDGDEQDRGDGPVNISHREFDLANAQDAVDFAREMFNLNNDMKEMSSDLDGSKESVLSAVNGAVKEITSLNSTSFPARTTSSSPVPSVEEQDKGGDTPHQNDEEDLGVFQAADIQALLRRKDYDFESVALGHPNLAVIRHKYHDRIAYLNIRHEVEILKYLSDIDSPMNYTIRGCQFWTVGGGTVILMPPAGRWLTSDPLLKKRLWSVANQLVDAVAFMHLHGVAHMDIKPHNVLIPEQGDRLSIIDFSSAVRVKDPNKRYTGLAGTEKYMAPEVKQGSYLPMKADLWSCGRTLEELCSRCPSRKSANRVFLLDVARKLMDDDPSQRPSMSMVQQLMVSRKSDVGHCAHSFGSLPETIMGA